MKTRGAPTYFNRHLLRSGLQCVTKLYYKYQHYPEDERIQPFLNHAGFNKYHLKKLLGHNFPDSIRINEKRRIQASKKTRLLLEKDRIILRDAVFICDQFFVKIPLLVKDGVHIQLCDLQTKVLKSHPPQLMNSKGEPRKKWEPYIIDLAYKKFVAQKIYADFKFETMLFLPSKNGAAINDRLLQKLQTSGADATESTLLTKIDVSAMTDKLLKGDSEMTKSHLKPFGEQIIALKDRYFSGSWQQPCLGKKCGRCEFRISQSQKSNGNESGFEKCWSKLTDASETEKNHPVLDLMGPGIPAWLERNIYLQRQIPLDDVPPLDAIKKAGKRITHKERQGLQLRKYRGEPVPQELIKQPIYDEIKRWEYPLHFIDFEAGNYAVPIRKDRSPYHLVLFQFSCHTLHQDGSLTHNEWLSDGTSYPSYELVRNLLEIPNINRGTIIQYSNFERYALKTVQKELKKDSDEVADASALIEGLDKVINRGDSTHPSGPYFADLSRLVKRFYYNRFMSNSLSIKDVVQAVLTVSVSLKERYSAPYCSSNFEDAQWWQGNEQSGQARNPYRILQEHQSGPPIGRGTQAMVCFGNILAGSLNGSKKEKTMQSLLKYCELDTLAMVMIYQHWNDAAKPN